MQFPSQFRRVLITGGAGFIGSHLAEALVASGVQVDILDDFSTGRPENLSALRDKTACTVTEGSIGDLDLVERLVQRNDLVVHLAAVVGVELVLSQTIRMVETNVQGTHNVLSGAGKFGRPILIASTSEVYGKGVSIPFREQDDALYGATTISRWSYAVSKALDEHLALAFGREKGLQVSIFRLFNTVGPRQTGMYGMVVPRFVQQALKGEPLSVHDDGLQSRCFLDVADAVRAIVAIASTRECVGKVLNVGSTDEITILDLARRVLELSGCQPDRVQFIPSSEARGPNFEDMRRRVPSIEKIQELTGWAPRISLDETINRVIASLQAP